MTSNDVITSAVVRTFIDMIYTMSQIVVVKFDFRLEMRVYENGVTQVYILVAVNKRIMSSGLLFKDQEALYRFQCPHCQQLLSNPVQLTCGHRLCELCADEVIQSNCPPLCPHEDCGEFTAENGVYVSSSL